MLNIMLGHLNKSRRGPHPEFANYIWQVAQDLRQIGPAPQDLQTYLQELISVFIHTYQKVRNMSGQTDWFSVDFSEQHIRYLSSGRQTLDDKLAAAAAVGNIAAVHQFLECGANPSNSKEEGLFNPIVAAAITGKVECLSALLNHVKTSDRAQGNPNGGLNKVLNLIELAVPRAILNSHPDAAVFLLKYYETHSTANTEDVDRLRRDCRTKAAKLGYIDLLKAVIDRRADTNMFEYYDNLQNAACVAITQGRATILKYFLEKRIITIWTTSPFRQFLATDPMRLAIRSRQENIVNLLLSFGARAPPLAAFLPAQKNGRQLQIPVYHIVRCLLDAGAFVDRPCPKYCEALSKHIVCSYRAHDESRCGLTDLTKTVVVISNAIREQLHSSEEIYGSTRTVLKMVVVGTISVPSGPLPFREIAEDVLEWLNAPVTDRIG